MAGGGHPALIRGVLLDLNLLLRISHGGLPAFRPSTGAAAVAEAAATAGVTSRRGPCECLVNVMYARSAIHSIESIDQFDHSHNTL